MREHGSLEEVEKHIRAKMAEREEAAAEIEAEEEVDAEEVPVFSDEEDEEEPEEPDTIDFESEDGYAPEDKDENAAGTPKKTKTAATTTPDKKKKAKSPEKKAAKKEPAKKKRVAGGMQLPEHWPWREAKQLFIKPDVTPADELEVSF